MPMLRAVPAITRIAASSEVAFMSFILSLTISRTCFRVTLPTLSFLDLPIFKFDRRVSAKNIHRHLKFAAFRFNFLDNPAEIEEWPVINLNGFPNIKADFWFLVFFRSRDLVLNRLDFFGRGRGR